MNEPTREDDRAYQHVPSDVIDNYAEYLDASLGYAWGLWERLPEETHLAHDRILEFGESAYIEATSLTGEDDLMLLALVRYHLSKNDTEAAITTLARVIVPPQKHNEINYFEIYVRMATAILDTVKLPEESAEAECVKPYIDTVLYSDKGDSQWLSEGQTYYRALYEYLKDKDFEATIAPMLKGPNHYERRFEIIEDLLAYGDREHAVEALEGLFEELVASVPNHPLMVDIRLLRSRLGGA